MTRFSYITLCAALMLAVASAATAVSLTSTAFAAAPGKVFDGTASTGADKDTWGKYHAAVFGPGTANTTVYAYGIAFDSPTAITKVATVASRALNATLLSNGTADTTIASAIGSDSIASPATSLTIGSGFLTAVGPGTMAFAYVATDAATVPCSQVYISIYTGGSTSPTTKAVTAQTCVLCKTGDKTVTGVGYTNTVSGLVYDNKTYYVTYKATKFTQTSDTAFTADACTSAPVAVTAGDTTHSPVNGQIMAYVQGLTTGGTATWTTAPAIYTGPTAATTIAFSAVNPRCGLSNWTNSSTLYCTYASSATALNYVPVTVSSGTAGTGGAIATSTTLDTTKTTSTTYNTYTVAGFVHSQYQQGILLNNQADTVTAPATSTAIASTVSTLQLYNLTSGATATAGGVSLNVSNTQSGGGYSAEGLPYSSGWGLIDNYQSGANAYTYELGGWYANGTTNGTKTAYATGASAAQSNYFVDANGALWAGAYTTDSNVLTTGYLGKLVAQTYSSTYGNLLVTFFGLISVVMAALFVF